MIGRFGPFLICIFKACQIDRFDCKASVMFEIQLKPNFSTLGKSNNCEWCIVEMQGDLETHGEKLDPGTLIGDIHFTKNGVPLLIIGHHILYGKVIDIEKPLVVLLKNTEKVSYTATAFIRKKLLFKTRPKPIISYIAKSVK